MQLSDRLKRVVDFVPHCTSVADIGTDHGYVPIALVKSGIAQKVYAMDIKRGPLERAREHIAKEGLQNQIETRLSNGLEKLEKGEAQTIVIAGMGGELMVKILDNGKEVLEEVKTLVLSPHSEIEIVRRYLIENGYEIVREEMLLDAGKYYTIMQAEKALFGWNKGNEYSQDFYYQYGKLLIEKKDLVLQEFLKQKEAKYQAILNSLEQQGKSEGHKARISEVREELSEMKQIRKLISEE